MKKPEEKNVPIFVGPSIGTSLLCFIPLLGLKLLGILNISWWWITCPLWIGWAVCLVLWLWFNSLAVVARTIFKPIVIPIVAKPENNQDEDKDGNHGM